MVIVAHAGIAVVQRLVIRSDRQPHKLGFRVMIQVDIRSTPLGQ
jgi:hypothetical protein